METEHKELEDFIKGVITAIDNSKQHNFVLKTPVDFEVSVLTKKEAGGKLRLFVADAGGKYEKEAISKIRFSMGYKSGTTVGPI